MGEKFHMIQSYSRIYRN